MTDERVNGSDPAAEERAVAAVPPPADEQAAPAASQTAEEPPMPDVHLEGEEEEQRQRRSLWGAIGAILIIIVIILILLLLRDCGGGKGASDAGGKHIVEIGAGYRPVRGVVSVWVADGTDIGSVLRLSGVPVRSRLNMGGGRYVLTVRNGTEEEVAATLRDQEGVHDAGLVYERPDRRSE